MSEANGKVCCNCRHNIRVEENNGVRCRCDVKDKYMGYVEVMEGWCRHWATDKKKWEESEVTDADSN